MNDDLFVVLDIGATNVRIASFHSLRNPSFSDTKAFQLMGDFSVDFEKIIGTIKDMARQKIAAIGVATPGTYDEGKSQLISATNLPQWVGQPIKQRLETVLGCPAFFENDGVASGLGQAVYNQNITNDFLFIIWGTGIGGAWITFTPTLKSEKINRQNYLAKMEAAYGGKTLLEKYGKSFSELEFSQQEEIIQDFLLNIKDQAQKFSVHNIILGGGIVLGHGEQILQAAKRLPNLNSLNFQITPHGEKFGLYGASALIKLHYSD